MLLNCGAWRRLLRIPWTARRSNQSILKEVNPDYSLEGLMLKLKLEYFGHLMRSANSLEKPDAGKDWGQEEMGATEDEMVGWHHQLNVHEFEQALGDGEGQGSLACCSPWGHKKSDTTEWLNWTELNWGDKTQYSRAMKNNRYMHLEMGTQEFITLETSGLQMTL